MNRVLRVVLHAAVDRGDDPEAVAVDVVGRAVGFGQHVIAVLVFLREHLLEFCAKRLPEVRGGTLVVAHTLKLQTQRLRLQRIGQSSVEVPVFGHLGQHHIPAVLHQFGAAERVVEGTVFEHAHQHGRLLHVQLGGGLVEVHIRRAFDAHRLVDEVVTVEVQRDDFLLGVVALEAGGDDPLLGLLEHRTLKEAGRLVLVGEQKLGELLGDRRPPASLAHEGNGAGQSDEVDAGVVVKTRVLGADERVDQMGRQVFESGVRTVLGVVPTQDLAVHGIDPGGKVGFGVGEGFGFWQVAEPGQHHQTRQAKQRPKAHQPQQQLPRNALHASKMGRGSASPAPL